MPVARRLTLTLLQEGHLCFALCWTSARANFFFKLGPYRAPNLFVLDIVDYEWGCPESRSSASRSVSAETYSNRGSMVFLFFRSSPRSSPKPLVIVARRAASKSLILLVTLLQATLQPHLFYL